jgi:transposase
MRRGPNLTTTQRNQIIGMLDGGASVTEVADAYGRTARCIRDLRKKYTQTGTTEDLPRSGRPPILSLSQKKIICRKARATPKLEYSELAEAGVLVQPDGTTTKPPSRSTLYRVLRRRGLINFCCKKRPKLTHGHALARLRFCRTWRNFLRHRRTIKFSDECLVERGSG